MPGKVDYTCSLSRILLLCNTLSELWMYTLSRILLFVAIRYTSPIRSSPTSSPYHVSRDTCRNSLLSCIDLNPRLVHPISPETMRSSSAQHCSLFHLRWLWDSHPDSFKRDSRISDQLRPTGRNPSSSSLFSTNRFS